MNIRKTRKRILSFLLALALCVGTWTGELQTVMAAEDGITEQNPPMQKLANNGDETGKDTKTVSGNGDDMDDDDTDDDTDDDIDDDIDDNTEETTLTDEEIETISEAICDALYDEIAGRFCEKWGELCDSAAAEYGLDDEDNEEITDELYAQFYAELYKSSRMLLEDVVKEELDAAGEQDAYAGLQNEAVYEKVYDSICDKLCEEYVERLKDASASMYADEPVPDRTDAVDLIATDKFKDQIGINEDETRVTVTIGEGENVEVRKYNPGDTIDLSDVDSNKTIKFSVQTSYKVIKGQYIMDDAGYLESDDTLKDRDLIGGDYFTVSGIPAALEIGTISPAILTANIDGYEEDMVEVAKEEGGSAVKYTFTENVNKSKEFLGITFVAGLEFTLKKEALSKDGPTNCSLDIPGNRYDITLPERASEWPEKIKKSGDYNKDDHTITWTIEMTPENRSLKGFTLEDVLDTTYQELVSVSWAGATLYKYDYDQKIEAVKADGIEVDTGTAGQTKISYTFGDTTTASNRKFIVKTRLNDEAEHALLQSAMSNSQTGQAVTLKPENSAYLTPPTGTDAQIDNQAESITVTVDGTDSKVVSKTYEQISADVIRWKITVNPGKNRIWKAVVTDELTNVPAKLSLIEGTVEIDGKPIDTDQNADTYYEYTTGVKDTLAVTFQNAFLANRKCVLTFDTKIGTHTDYTGNITKIENEAKIKCYFPQGSGIGPMDWETGVIEFDAAEHMLSKEYAGFDKRTGMIKWELKPSCGSTAFEHAKVTDYVGRTSDANGSRTAEGNTQSLDVNSIEVEVRGQKVQAGSCYTCDIDEVNNTFTITFCGDTDCTDHSVHLTPEDLNTVSVTYQTHAEDWGVSAETDGTAADQQYYNTASLQVDNEKTIYANADTGVITDKMLKKSAASYYDNEACKSGFRYTIEVNNDEIEFTGGVLF